MYNSKVLLSVFAVLALFSCRKPKPLDITVPQGKSQMVISAAIMDDHSIMITAGYSIQSLAKLGDTLSDGGLSKEMLVDEGVVTIAEQGQPSTTLYRIAAGLYGTRDLKLKHGAVCTLTVTDTKKSITSTATTTYASTPHPVEIASKFINGINNDTLLKFDIAISDASNNDRYFITYTSTKQLRESASILRNGFSTKGLGSFEPKKIQLIDGSKATGGVLRHSFTINASANDTMIVQVAQVDEAYYKYLTAYKNTGYLINQLTGEPINLPSNVKTGYGYFALYDIKRFVIDLKKI